MSLFREVMLDGNAAALSAYREKVGFLPNLMRAQSLMPRLVEAHIKLESAVLLADGALSREQKEQIVLVVAASRGDAYSVMVRGKVLNSLGVADSQIERLLVNYRLAGMSSSEVVLMDFCLKLSHYAPWISGEDIDRLRGCGFDDGAILEAVLATGFASYLCALTVGLGPKPDFELRQLLPIPVTQPAWTSGSRGLKSHEAQGNSERKSYLQSVYRSPKTFEPYILILESHGFIPNFFRAQTARPDLIGPEAEVIVGILLPQ
ncbi:MAG: hypothetical protein ACRD4K_04495, partial [Candidatus Acidiferrales bacterium]